MAVGAVRLKSAVVVASSATFAGVLASVYRSALAGHLVGTGAEPEAVGAVVGSRGATPARKGGDLRALDRQTVVGIGDRALDEARRHGRDADRTAARQD